MTDVGRELRGFVLYLTSIALFVCYLAWMLLSDSVLESIGVTYYPNRYWGLILPWWTLGLIPFTLMSITGLSMLATPPLESLSTVTDEYSQLITMVPVEYEGGPGLLDISLTIVNRALLNQQSTNGYTC
ncbi:phosphatidylinositol N-acetylglucosaminyltransferase [Synchytrium endobioticum]|uniref:Phosphatidylinositol N-acetylglucosaminyltransferase n=1 Tax=Synchytrium endobioticum TaxID=286115 RepID=A0A507DII9_9FUNG|nr:phosphatidylinositol N-acetylglucosaminyltransferase [Synchytrium endobioticum]TPX53403.1 phosphatidylinositol N-acetylglucosaminyltransferase [Synchytrium endobioticum]